MNNQVMRSRKARLISIEGEIISSMKKIELVVQAQNLEALKNAIASGANAVYIGGEVYQLRAEETDFTIEEMKEAVRYAHEHDAKVYVTANIFAHNNDLSEVKEYMEQLKEVNPDAILVSDPGVFAIVKEVIPEMNVHISTQENNTNYITCRFWWNQGATRVVSARDLSLEELKEIKTKIPEEMQMEIFVHGAMCMSYSGRRLISNYVDGGSPMKNNQAYSAEKSYNVVENTRQGEYMPVYENERGTFIFHSEELCMIDHIPDLVDAGMDSLKIESFMYNQEQLQTIIAIYRKAVDKYLAAPEEYAKEVEGYKQALADTTARKFTTGFYFGHPSENK